MIRLLLRSMRPRQWIKNVFVLAALIFSQHLLDGTYALRSLAAFALFCLLSGAIYLINDLFDIEKDRSHPEKRHRPLASGRLAPSTALIAAVLILALSLAGSFALHWTFGLIVLGYGAMNLAYSAWLKRVVILDVMIVAFGFLLRAVAGALVIEVEISSWFVLCTALLALFLGFVKRRHERIALAENATGHREALEEYSPQFLDQMIAVVTSSALVTYALYTMSSEVMTKLGTERLILTIPFVLYGIFRYLYLAYEKNEGGSPASVLLRDRPLQINIGLWALSVVVILYLLPPR